MSHRIRSGGCCCLAKGGTGWIGGPSTPPQRNPHPLLSPLGLSPAGKASCWLNLDMEVLREQFFAIRSKRRKLGEEPGMGKGTLGALQPGTGGTGPWKSVEGDGLGVGTPHPGPSISCPVPPSHLGTSSPQSCGTEHRPGRETWATPWPCWASWH